MKVRAIQLTLMIVAGLGYMLTCHAYSQSGSNQRQGSGSDARDSRVQASADFEERFWNYIADGNHRYDYWGPFEHRVGLLESRAPHGPKLRIYANRVARQTDDPFEANSIIIAENYEVDGDTLSSVTVMYKIDRFDAENQDWYYLKYLPGGVVDRIPDPRGARKISGRVPDCIACHRDAGGGDFVFSNDDESVAIHDGTTTQ